MKRVKDHFVPALVAVALVVAWASASAAPVISGDNVSIKVLDNGLRVVVKEENTWPIVSMGMYIKAGSLHEGTAEAGAAHMVEHLLFEAEPVEGEGKVAEYIEGIGGRINAFTGRDFTHVDVTVASQYVETALQSLVETVLGAQFDDEVVVKEQMVVLREIADRSANSSLDMGTVLWGLAYPDHPYGRPIGGTADQVRTLTVDAIRGFYNRFYVPNNMTLVAVGRLDADWLFERVERLTRDRRARPVQWASPAPAAPLSGIQRDIATRDSEIAAVVFGWRAPGISEKRDVCATDLIYTLLGQGATGRLHKRLVEQDKLAAGVDILYLTQQEPGLFILTVAILEKNELVVRKAVLEEIKRLTNEKVSEEELARAKRLLRTEYAFSNESYAGQVGSLGFYDAIDTYEFAIDYIDQVNAVTVDDIQRVSERVFDTDGYAMVIRRRDKDVPPGQEVRLHCLNAS